MNHRHKTAFKPLIPPAPWPFLSRWTLVWNTGPCRPDGFRSGVIFRTSQPEASARDLLKHWQNAIAQSLTDVSGCDGGKRATSKLTLRVVIWAAYFWTLPDQWCRAEISFRQAPDSDCQQRSQRERRGCGRRRSSGCRESNLHENKRSPTNRSHGLQYEITGIPFL